jgi:hypothetical protein
MTDEEIQRFANQRVRLRYAGQVVTGTLVVGFAAQTQVQAPYAIQWYDVNPTLGVKEERLAAIASAEAVEWMEPVEEAAEARAEIADAAEDARTPG